MYKHFFFIAMLLTTGVVAKAQEGAAQGKLFTLEELNFGGVNYHKMQPDNMFLTWWGEQLMYQDAEEGGIIDDKGQRKALFTLAEVETATSAKGQEVLMPQWHTAMYAHYPYPDKPLVLLRNSHERILFNFETKQVEWRQPCNGERESHWCPASRHVAYVNGKQLCVRTANGEERRLTDDGSRDVVYGQSVHRNEFGINEGMFWSPDGQKLAFYRMDQTMVEDYPQVDIFEREAKHDPDKYPMAGMNTHRVTVGIYDVATGKTLYLQTPEGSLAPNDDTTPVYFTNIVWSPDNKALYIQELNRKQNHMQLVRYDTSSGQREAILLTKTSDKYVEPLHPIRFLPWDQGQFLMQSQEDGYNHLYIYNVEGQLIRQLTQGPFVVLDLLGFNEKQKSVVIASNEAHPLQKNIYSVSVKTGQRKPLDNGEGWHNAVLSGTGQKMFDRYSSPTLPRAINISETSGKRKERQLLRANDPWAGYQQPIFESGKLKAADGQTDLYWRMVKPHDFSPEKKYPTVVYVYGGPHAHNVDASWHWASRSWETYMAQKGYIVFILDNRGSEHRGLAFEQATWHQLGQVEMDDQMAGVAFLKSLPYVDADRLGIHGWSYGGYMTISLMTNHPDVFKVGVAGGPVIDWQWYEVMYGERYMGTPQDNAEGYAKTSLVKRAKDLKGRLQIIIGYNDDTVVPQHALSFLKACADAGTQPDLFVYPGEGHNMRGHASVHLHERITRYFEDYLK
jgi:dipeptidyl-peptidase-4